MSKLQPAASICLVHLATRSILLGRRLVGAWPGYWAFPGGKLEPGEDALSGGLRELFEETGLRIEAREPLCRTVVEVSFGDKHYEIENFALEVDERVPGIVTTELEPRWVELDAVGQLAPIAHGTRTVIEAVTAVLG